MSTSFMAVRENEVGQSRWWWTEGGGVASIWCGAVQGNDASGGSCDAAAAADEIYDVAPPRRWPRPGGGCWLGAGQSALQCIGELFNDCLYVFLRALPALPPQTPPSREG